MATNKQYRKNPSILTDGHAIHDKKQLTEGKYKIRSNKNSFKKEGKDLINKNKVI